MPRRPLLPWLAALPLAACSPAALLNAVAPRRGVAIGSDRYADGPRHGVDIYTAVGAPAAPVLVFLYGGGWKSGDRATYRFVGAAMAAAGITCVIPDYRLWPEAGIPAILQDAAAAVAWTSRRVVGDGGRVWLMGHSAGAHLATMLALDARYLQQAGGDAGQLQGVVGLAGPYDFLPLQSEGLRAIFGPEDAWPATQPVNFVRPGAPPMLLATGDADTTVLPRNSASLAARLQAAGNQARLVTYRGLGHTGIIGAFAGPLRFLAPVAQDVQQFILGASA